MYKDKEETKGVKNKRIKIEKKIKGYPFQKLLPFKNVNL